MDLHHPAGFELRFQSLFTEGRGLAFPCDADGQVDLDALSARARDNYFFARGGVGRDYAVPTVRLASADVANTTLVGRHGLRAFAHHA
jgi:hypothetical protein